MRIRVVVARRLELEDEEEGAGASAFESAARAVDSVESSWPMSSSRRLMIGIVSATVLVLPASWS